MYLVVCVGHPKGGREVRWYLGDRDAPGPARRARTKREPTVPAQSQQQFIGVLGWPRPVLRGVVRGQTGVPRPLIYYCHGTLSQGFISWACSHTYRHCLASCLVSDGDNTQRLQPARSPKQERVPPRILIPIHVCSKSRIPIQTPVDSYFVDQVRLGPKTRGMTAAWYEYNTNYGLYGTPVPAYPDHPPGDNGHTRTPSVGLCLSACSAKPGFLTNPSSSVSRRFRDL